MRKSNLTELFQGHVKVLCHELGMDYNEVKKVLIIQEFKNPERVGTVQVQRKANGSISKIILYIKTKMSWDETLLVLAHEMVHVKQNLTGDIRVEYFSKTNLPLKMVISRKRIKSRNIWKLYERNYKLYFKGECIIDFYNRDCEIELEAERAEVNLAKVLIDYEVENDIQPLVA